MDPVKLLTRLTRGAQANVRFADMQALVEAFGYQVRQFLRLVERYGVRLEKR